MYFRILTGQMADFPDTLVPPHVLNEAPKMKELGDPDLYARGVLYGKMVGVLVVSFRV